MTADAELESRLSSTARHLGEHHESLRGTARPIGVWAELPLIADWLQEARLACIDPPAQAGKAAEWLLDNDYQVHRALRQIKTDLPPAFYSRLPALSDAREACPRIFIVAHELLSATKMQISLSSAVIFIKDYQRGAPLTIAELWAFPTMLRIACVETLVAALTPLLEGRIGIPVELSECARNPHSLDATERVARAVANLGVIAAIPWEEFFDQTSLVEKKLTEDPARFYARMDFETRDQYRRAVEEIARDSGNTEGGVAAYVVLKSESGDAFGAGRHVGYWLIGKGRKDVERAFVARLPPDRRLRQFILARPGLFYASAMGLAGVCALILPALYLYAVGAGPLGWLAGLILTQIPASVLATAAVNWTVTQLLPPRVLPKLDCSDGLPPDSPTIIAVPVVVGDANEAVRLVGQLETHWLANRDTMLQLVLLADLADAQEEHAAGDGDVVRALEQGIGDLNRRHGTEGCGPFHLLLRPRIENSAQGCWMAWERKRGKLEQFNRFLLEGDATPFSSHVGYRGALSSVRFVITVDADTMLPSGSVARLVGALAHPLNHARIDSTTGRVVAGYSVIQPRVEISPQSGSRTIFARLFTGDTAIDIYSQAVSDVYQDLFGAGIFVGKGIYDLRAFHASVDGRVPENCILSHDLFEGAHGRAALATDIVLYEGFPSSYSEFARRMHRWIRGDWQLLPWLRQTVPDARGGRVLNAISGIDRWKLTDNLRRSLVAPGSVLLALAGWLVLPGSPLFWTALVVFAPGAQLFTDLVSGLARGRRRGAAYGFVSHLTDQAGRWALALVYMLHEALLSLHAIGVTLWRSFVSHRRMLEWTSAAQLAARMEGQQSRRRVWAQMWPASTLALLIVAAVLTLRPSALVAALPLLGLWVLAPEITLWIGRPRRELVEPLSEDDKTFLRLLARKTWLYFETFAGPEDNWLPPDNYQGEPYEEIAHRTSPTNIGMLLLSTATAWDLGYIGRAELAARTRNLFDSLAELERYRGHFYNWYDTLHLTPLEPRYVSTVDSGNLAVSLIAFAEALREAAPSVQFEISRWQGLRDSFDLVLRAGADIAPADHDFAAAATRIRDRLDRIEGRPAEWPGELASLCAGSIPLLESEAGRIAERANPNAATATGDLVAWLDRLRHQALAMRNDLSEPGSVAAELSALADEATALAWSMEFGPLYDSERSLFHIGHNVSASRIDQHHYDLLASEARLASFFAIAKGDVPVEHWFHLERPVRKVPGGLTLVSWSGSMFEYLLPRLLLRSRAETLLGESERLAVEVQRRHGESNGIPWGASESAYASRDPEHRFRYQAFGVPGLGLRRGLAREMVVAPYASALALAVAAASATANLRRLEKLGASGRYGLWEALDFTPGRGANHAPFAPVNAFMAHHQGMVLCAIGNVLTDDLLVTRFARDPQVQLVSLLLSERLPREVPPEIEHLEEPEGAGVTQIAMRAPPAWEPAPAPFPQVHRGGNGRLSSWISDGGGGGLSWHGHALTRFVADATRDGDGLWLYVCDEESGDLWSATPRPTGANADESHTIYHAHMAEFHRRDHGIDLRQEVVVSAGEDLEIRRFCVVNESGRDRRLRFTSYAEVTLAPPMEEERHPAFSKLFVGSEVLPQLGGLLFTRRPRSPRETPPVLLQFLIGVDGPLQSPGYATDRRRFVGRGRTLRDPAGARSALAETAGWTLDAVSALQISADLAPGKRYEFALVTIAAATRDVAFEIAERYVTLSSIEWLFADAEAEANRMIARSRIDPSLLPEIQSLGSLLVYPHGAMRTDSKGNPANSRGQSDLWGLALSGDLPILLLRTDAADNALLRELTCAHNLWRRLGLEVDLVVMQQGGSAYVEPLREEVANMLRELEATELLGRRGGIHLLFADQIGPEQVRLVEAVAWIVVDGGAGSLSDQLREACRTRSEIPPFIASIPEEYDLAPVLERPVDLLFDNGTGGFGADGREYVIHLEAGQTTPAPWANILANDQFGTLVTESGGGFSWSVNSGENRLTPWTNDPVVDRPVETLYLRDEETGGIWTSTPAPAGGDTAVQIRHGAGYSEWRQNSHGLEQTLRVLVPNDAPVKLVKLSLRNTGGRHRRLTATYYAEWLLGSLPSVARRHVQCGLDEAAQVILARNCWNADFAQRVAFLAASAPLHGFTCSRQEFLGRGGNWACPAGLLRWGLSGQLTPGEDACAAYQVHIDLPAEATEEIVFILGQGASQGEAITLAAQWQATGMFDQAEAALARNWDELLGAVQVRTPDPAFDLIINRWLIYQSLSSRVLGRTGFYQASGAFGFRDQLQDLLAFTLIDPSRLRDHILTCAKHQFSEGDVLHWWHPPAGRGVRTRCSDDLIWLPYAVGTYVDATGDVAILDEEVAFLEAPPLNDTEEDRYSHFETGERHATLLEHCERALEHMSFGARGLPLMGSGDWNDGMDRVGDAGLGESVWLAWFAAVSAELMAAVNRRVGREQDAGRWTSLATKLRAAAEEAGWDGAWYRRAYDDEGDPLGSAENSECRIDSISQSWGVFAGAASARLSAALEAAGKELIDREGQLVRLLWPPFDQTPRDPGYIKAYPPGVRENGGQYSHAAAWLGLAFAATGQGERAKQVFDMLNPIRRAQDRVSAELYRLEPFVMAGDVATAAPLRGRGGWSWYTGAAAWTWRLGIEGILGVTLRDGQVCIDPSLPEGWDKVEITLRKGGARINLRVENPDGVGRTREISLEIDGVAQDGREFSFPEKGATRSVIARLVAPSIRPLRTV